MRITSIDTHVLLAHDMKAGATSSAQDDFVVEVHTDEGISGIGESDINPWIARACVEAPSTHSMGMGLKDMLIGEDPLDPSRLWTKLYEGSAMNGRRGAVINALGALDIALWDIAGQVAGKPIYELLGGAKRAEVTPYASLLPDAHTYADFKPALVDWAVRAKQEFGFKAAKLEVILDGPYAHLGIHATDEQVTEVIAAVRSAVGPDMTLMVDVGYAWNDVDRAARCIADWKDLDILFVETPLRSDDMEGYARLHDRDIGMKIAAGEWLTTRYEFHELLDHGKADIAQPDAGRVGGLTEARRVAEMAAERGKSIVPHAWKTGISITAAIHLAAASANCLFIEYLPAQLTDSALRMELTTDDLRMHDGVIALPTEPGLGVHLSRAALDKFRVA
jgi:L-alanine-DL-glutamate epimerase-like enolase superfamily enzyme